MLEIQGSAGDACLGGEDFLEAMADALALEAQERFGFDPRSTPAAWAVFLDACERTKRQLSAETEVQMPVTTPGDQVHRMTVTRGAVEGTWAKTLQRMHPPIRRALRDAGVVLERIDEVVLVGGATRMPIVRQLTEELFGRPPLTDIPADEAVAQGAAIQAALKNDDEALEDMVATDIAPFLLGVSTVETRGRRRLDDVFSPILERGTVLPASRVERFVTAGDAQSAILVEVFQGEHSLCRDNTKLGEYELGGLPPGPAGEEAIDVRFSYDLNGILEVDMTILSKGSTETLVLERSAGKMSPQQVAEARDALSRLKFHPRDALPNTTALARAESLFTELRGAEREMLSRAMRAFRLALEEQDSAAIEAERGQLLALIKSLRG